MRNLVWHGEHCSQAGAFLLADEIQKFSIMGMKELLVNRTKILT